MNFLKALLVAWVGISFVSAEAVTLRNGKTYKSVVDRNNQALEVADAFGPCDDCFHMEQRNTVFRAVYKIVNNSAKLLMAPVSEVLVFGLRPSVTLIKAIYREIVGKVFN